MWSLWTGGIPMQVVTKAVLTVIEIKLCSTLCQYQFKKEGTQRKQVVKVEQITK